ncbi:hypothetical protein B7494_g3704 [Chlorociboria aeruginascens]|nr:hypothetical protein B7494_g3704 [Chlorociboria aeruginascens]
MTLISLREKVKIRSNQDRLVEACFVDAPLPESRPSTPVSDVSTLVDTATVDYEEDKDSLKRLERACQQLTTTAHNVRLRGRRHLTEVRDRYPSVFGFNFESPFRYSDLESDVLGDALRKKTGTTFAVPDDGRIPLRLSADGLEIKHLKGAIPRNLRDRFIGNILRAIDHVKNFDDKLHAAHGCDFRIADLDPWRSTKGGYLITACGLLNILDSSSLSKIQKHEIVVEDPATASLFNPRRFFQPHVTMSRARDSHCLADIGAPWRRIIFVQGLSSIKVGDDQTPDCPYLDEYRLSLAAWHMIRIHLECTRIPGSRSANPYNSISNHEDRSQQRAFSITFLEILPGRSYLTEASWWKIGQLFNDDGKEYLFRRSAFSVHVEAGSRYDGKTLVSSDPPGLTPLYTVLLLVPQGFSNPSKVEMELEETLESNTQIEAELHCIVKGLTGVIQRWSYLDRYLENLLVEDFMEPSDYAKLLFDDENFSRSQKYFWAIGCLGEFDTNISDNIKQLDLYTAARIQPLLARPDLAERLDAACLNPPQGMTSQERGACRLEEFMELIKKADHARESLVNLQSQFRKTLETVKALRDGLFNASTLMESRSATRLAENVKLLTYVSIFYLPLAFCAALWAIPNIGDRSTKVPFLITTILVGATTYAVVFNMEYMTRKLRNLYYPRRQSLLNQMQQEKGQWKDIGQRFQEFKPLNERKLPTEWWIPVYAIRHIWQKILPDTSVDGQPNAFPPDSDQRIITARQASEFEQAFIPLDPNFRPPATNKATISRTACCLLFFCNDPSTRSVDSQILPICVNLHKIDEGTLLWMAPDFPDQSVVVAVTTTIFEGIDELFMHVTIGLEVSTLS